MSSLSNHLDFRPDPECHLASNRLTAVNTGIAGRTVLLPSEEAAEYQRNAAAYIDTYKPLGLREGELVQSLSETMWRLQRIYRLEMAIFAQGSTEFDEAFDDHPASFRPQMIELQTFLKYEKQLRNLQVQESRLQRRYEKDSAELRNLQRQRAQKEESVPANDLKNQKGNSASSCEPKTQKIAASAPVSASRTVSNPKNGFVFSNATPNSPASDLSYPSSAPQLHLE